jgi:ribosomal protein S18 acetylase RimI-like enzyme
MDLIECIDETRAAELLCLCIGFPTQSKVQAVLRQYQDDPARKLFCCQLDGIMVGCVGVSLEQDKTLLQHIAVSPHYQQRRIGQFMIGALFPALNFDCLEAETDEDAVGFYIKCGFIVTSLGEVHPNTERFRCVLSAT